MLKKIQLLFSWQQFWPNWIAYQSIKTCAYYNGFKAGHFAPWYQTTPDWRYFNFCIISHSKCFNSFHEDWNPKYNIPYFLLLITEAKKIMQKFHHVSSEECLFLNYWEFYQWLWNSGNGGSKYLQGRWIFKSLIFFSVRQLFISAGKSIQHRFLTTFVWRLEKTGEKSAETNATGRLYTASKGFTNFNLFYEENAVKKWIFFYFC